MNRNRTQPISLYLVPTGLLLTNLLILATDVSPLRLAAALALIFVLPGLAWLQAMDWFQTRCSLERLVLIGGLSVAIASISMLAAAYWPQPLNLAQTLIALDAATLIGVVLSLRRHKAPPSGSAGWNWPRPRVLIALLLILGVAAFLRWHTIGYGEFHEDEIENMRLAVRAMKGEEYAPFLDSKGPTHWLIPGAVWLMHGWINEAIARSPFVICSMLTVLAVYVLGRRLAGSVVGLIGSGFVAVNGLLVAYARHVEIPSIVVLWGVLAAWCAYGFYRMGAAPGRTGDRLQILGWLFLGIGLVSHPTMTLYLPPFMFMIGFTYWKHPGIWRQHWRASLAGVALFTILVATFYVPFFLDPNFQHAVEYFAEERVGTRILYNQVADLWEMEGEYSTRYFMPLVLLFSGIVFAGELRRLGRTGMLLAVAIAAAALTTVAWPRLWEWGALNGAVLPYAILFITLALLPQTSFEVKSLVLWFGVPYLALTFFARDAATHIRNVYPAWLLLAGLGAKAYWYRLNGWWGQWVKIGTVVVITCILGLILYYQHLQFLGTVTAYWRAEADAKYNEASIYRLLYGRLPRPRKLVSNPRLGGWKVVGVLYDEGSLQGDFRSIKESFAVPIWYTHQMPRSCFDDPYNYFVAMGARGRPEAMDHLPANGYGLTRLVLVDGHPKLYLFENSAPAADEPAIYHVDDYRATFDRSATPDRYSQEAPAQHPLHLTFGERLLLRGYDISTTQPSPGETVALTLHWQAVAPMSTRYRAFVHIETDRIWGQHDDDPACRLRTDEWRPPQTALGQFRVTLDPSIPPGTYPVIIGVYHPDTWERLDIVSERGQSVGSILELTTITIHP